MAESGVNGATQEHMEVDKIPSDIETVQVDISWPHNEFPKKWLIILEKSLQTMFSKDPQISCDVCSVHALDKPHSVIVKISPTSGLSRLLEVKSAKLKLKDLDEVVQVSFSQPGSSVNSGDQKKNPMPVSATVHPGDTNPQDPDTIMKKNKHHQAANDYQSDVIWPGEVAKKHQDGNMAESGVNGATQEHMEVDEVPCDIETVQVDISWTHEDFPQNLPKVLRKSLQAMFDKDPRISCDVCSVHVLDKPHSVMVKISPASVLSRLLEVKSAKLKLKDLDEVVQVSFSQPGSSVNSGDQKKNPVPISATVYPRDTNPQDQGAIMKKSKHHHGALPNAGSTGNAQSAGNGQSAGNARRQHQTPLGEENDEQENNGAYSNRPMHEDLMECRVPVFLYTCLSSAYREEMDNIERKFGVTFKDVVSVSIEANGQKDREQANRAFTELVRRCWGNFESVTIPKAKLEPDLLAEIVKQIQEDEEAKLEMSISTEGYRLSGPKESIKEFMRRIKVMSATPKALRPVLRDHKEKTDEPELRDLQEAAGTSRNPPAAVDEEDICPICLDTLKNKQKLNCKHVFCTSCLDSAVRSMGPLCPVCKQIFGQVVGDQPAGRMSCRLIPCKLAGFRNCDTIEIDYCIPDGIQTERHPNPGRRFHGTQRQAYLPNNREGNEVLNLLKKAFEQKLIFTVGVSRTTGMSDTVIWNDIHHKTCLTGGPTSFGYPDPGYLARVREELKAKDIK